MALLLKKKHIIDSLGEEQELNIYTTKTEAVDTEKPCKVIQVEVGGEMITSYIGCTDELDTPKASSKRVMISGVEYAERKYMGIKSMQYYMKNTYPTSYLTMTIIKDGFPDSSDSTNFARTFYDCRKLENVPDVDTRSGIDFSYMYYNCSSATTFPQLDTYKGANFNNMYQYCSKATSFPELNTFSGIDFSYMYEKSTSATSFPKLNTSKGITLQSMYAWCSSATEFPQIDTSKATNLKWLYSRCSSAIIVSDIDLSKATDSSLAGVDVTAMFEYCSSLRSITFNNLPPGTTEATLRSKCGIPSTVTEIIMNYRSE